MNRCFIFALWMFASLPLCAQSQYNGIFHSEHTGNPEIQADGIFQFFVESDNQLKFGNTEQAILLLDNAIAQNPFFAETYLKRSQILTRLGRKAEAREDFLTAQRLNPYLAKIMSPNVGFEKLELIAFDPTLHEEVLEAEFGSETRSILYGSIEKKMSGDVHGALNDLELVFDRVQQPNALLYYLRGNLYLLLEDYRGAIADYSSAIVLSPDVDTFYFSRGMTRLFTYDRNAACEDLTRSSEMGCERSGEKLKYFCYY